MQLAKAYGRALYELASETDEQELMLEELRKLSECFSQEPDFTRLLCCRSVAVEERIGVLEEVFSGRIHPYLLNFMRLLCRRGAMGELSECAAVFCRLYYNDFGLTEAHVESAAPLAEDQKTALRKRLEQISGKKVVLAIDVNPRLIGGVRVEMDGRRLDNTIQTRLSRLRRSLNENELERR